MGGYRYDIELLKAAVGGGIPGALNDLSDVNTTGLADGEVLTYDSGTSQWVPEPPSAGALNDLTDVATAGAADNDVLTYDSGTSSWGPAAPSGGSGAVATDTLWDAKGDLAGGTGANTAARLPVGTNGDVLTADSAEATGMKWATPAGANVQYQHQAATLSIASNTTYQDTDLVFNCVAGNTYRVEFVVHEYAHATPDMKRQVAFTGTATDVFGSQEIMLNTTIYPALMYAMPLALGVLTTTANHRTRADMVFTCTADGVLSYQVAQNVSSATAISFYKNSYGRCEKIN